MCIFHFVEMFYNQNQSILPRISRIFVNRNMLMEKIKFFGFDMDYTLAGIMV